MEKRKRESIMGEGTGRGRKERGYEGWEGNEGIGKKGEGEVGGRNEGKEEGSKRKGDEGEGNGILMPQSFSAI